MGCTRKQDVDCEVGNCMNLICRDYKVIRTPSASCNTCQSVSSCRWNVRPSRGTRTCLSVRLLYPQQRQCGIWIETSRSEYREETTHVSLTSARQSIAQQAARCLPACRTWVRSMRHRIPRLLWKDTSHSHAFKMQKVSL